MRTAFLAKDFGMFPLGPAYLMGQVRGKRAFATFERAQEVGRADAFCYTLLSGFEGEALALARALRREFPRALHLFGGPHVTLNPEILQEQGVDAICRGEGDECLPKFLQVWEETRRLDRVQVAGMSTRYFDGGAVLVSDLDALVTPDRELIFAHLPRYRGITAPTMMASRGCPYRCSYCFNEAYHQIFRGQKMVRHRSPARVIEEMQALEDCVAAQGRSIQAIRFMDDAFPAQAQWLREFIGLREARGCQIRWTGHFRVEVLSSQVIGLLKEAGCIGVSCAIECANEQVRKEALNRHMDNRTIVHVFAELKSHGIGIMSQNMVGIPGSTLDDDYATLALNQQVQPDFGWCSICHPYPKTRLYEYAQTQGMQMGEAVQDFCRQGDQASPDAEERLAIQQLFSLLSHYGIQPESVREFVRLPSPVRNFIYTLGEMYFLRQFLRGKRPARLPRYMRFLNAAIAQAGRGKLPRIMRQREEF